MTDTVRVSVDGDMVKLYVREHGVRHAYPKLNPDQAVDLGRRLYNAAKEAQSNMEEP